MEHSHNDSSSHNGKPGLLFIYFGESGAAVFAFIMVLILATCIYSFLRWG